MFNTSRIKFILIAISLLFAGGVLFYSQTIVSDLREESEQSLIFYTELYARLAGDTEFSDYGFFFEEIIPRISFPIIITVPETDEINAWKNLNGISDTADLTTAMEEELLLISQKMDDNNAPVLLTIEDQTVGIIHYDDSITIRRLTWLPFIEILGVILYLPSAIIVVFCL